MKLMKTIKLERERNLKIYNVDGEENEKYFQIVSKRDGKNIKQEIGFFDHKESLIRELTAYMYQDELNNLVNNEKFNNSILALH